MTEIGLTRGSLSTPFTKQNAFLKYGFRASWDIIWGLPASEKEIEKTSFNLNSNVHNHGQQTSLYVLTEPIMISLQSKGGRDKICKRIF